VTKEAFLALGRVANDESIEFLRQGLARGPEVNRAEVAAACLLAAEKRLADDQTETAVELYDTVRNAKVPPSYRAAATRGSIVARKASGVPLLIEQLRSDERLFRNAALLSIREIPSDALATALNAEVAQAPAELQIQLLTALGDCYNAQSLSVLQAMTASENPEARKTAMTVLGRIGGAADVGVLLDVVAKNRSAGESASAVSSLSRMQGVAIDPQIVSALAATTDAATRIQFIRVLENRAATNAVGELLRQAGDPDAKVSLAALRALKSLASYADLSALIALTRYGKSEDVREAAENAVIGVCNRTGTAAAGSEAVLVELKRASDPAVKNSWIRILASLGNPTALPAILAAANDPNESVAANAIEQLANWPDPAPVDDLFAVVQTGGKPALRNRALTSAIQLATTAAEDHQSPTDTLVKWFELANQAAQTTDDRRRILSGLGHLKDIRSFRLLAPYLDDPALHNEAAVAIVQIAPALLQEEPAALKEALEKIAATATSPDIRQQAAQIAGRIPRQPKRISLFDGRSLTGWEGDPNVWRVRDGVIVGGSLNGNPRNEFLATVARFTNFVLRLEYKLVGTDGFVNSGVQFRSVRVRQPPNEMCGFQADIGTGYSGSLYDESRRNRQLAQPTSQQIQRLEKPGDWNRYEVRCAGPRIQIALNGEKTVDYTETDPAIPLDGLIALQIHGGAKSEVSFRNLTIEEAVQP
jgi:HEAT repeat protein